VSKFGVYGRFKRLSYEPHCLKHLPQLPVRSLCVCMCVVCCVLCVVCLCARARVRGYVCLCVASILSDFFLAFLLSFCLPRFPSRSLNTHTQLPLVDTQAP